MRKIFHFFVILAMILSACSQKKDQPVATEVLSTESDRKICIDNAGWLAFSKSYSFLMSSELSEKEKDKMMEETEKGNPGYNYKSDDSLLKQQFYKFEFVKGDELLLKKFRYSNKPDTSITTSTGTEIKIRFKRDSWAGKNNRLIVYSGKDSAQVWMYGYMELKYAFLDIIPGGNKEIVVLYEGHVSNTDLYDLFVYKIETKE